jgi:hypothetical protein
MGRSKQTFGVVSSGTPYWSWFAGSVGDCRWIHCDEDVIVHGIFKPRFVDAIETKLCELLEAETVETVLFDGCQPGVNSPV